MKELENYNVCGVDVSFLVRGDVWVNATEMAKGFGKEPYGWLRLQSTKDYLDALIKFKSKRETPQNLRSLENNQSLNLIQTTEGKNGGTWFHEDVAIEFARWLSPEFSIACNSIIKQIFKEGHVDLRQMLSIREQMETKNLKETAGFNVEDDFAVMLPLLWSWINEYEVITLPKNSDKYLSSGQVRNMFKKFLEQKGENTNRNLYVTRFLRMIGVPYMNGSTASRKWFFVELNKK